MWTCGRAVDLERLMIRGKRHGAVLLRVRGERSKILFLSEKGMVALGPATTVAASRVATGDQNSPGRFVISWFAKVATAGNGVVPLTAGNITDGWGGVDL